METCAALCYDIDTTETVTDFFIKFLSDKAKTTFERRWFLLCIRSFGCTRRKKVGNRAPVPAAAKRENPILYATIRKTE